MNTPQPANNGASLRLTLLIALLAGIASLIYEIVWSRYLHLIFGISAHAVATVLACYMIGLACGSWVLGSRIDRAQRPKRLLCTVQLILAGYILVSPIVYYVLSVIAVAVSKRFDAGDVMQNVVRMILAMIALAVPTFLMGGMIPMLIRVAAGKSADVGSRAGVIYAINTLGGAIGSLITGFFLIQYLGLIGSLCVAALLSIAGALLSLRLALVEAQPATAPPKRHIQFSLPVIVFAISGFTSLAYEVFWTRALAFFFRDSIYDLTIVLTTFLLGIVIGGLLGSALVRRFSNSQTSLAAVELLIGIFALVGLFLVGEFPYWINYLQTNTALVDRFGDRFWLVGSFIRFGYASLLMLVPTCLFGMTFPIIARLIADSGDSLGQQIGFVSAMNTLGSALGALVGGFVLISAIGLHNSIIATAFLNVVPGLLLVAKMRDNRVLVGLTSLVAVAVLLAAVLPGWDKLRMSSSFLDPRQNQPIENLLALHFYREDATGQTAVVELKPLEKKYLVTNRLFGQNTSDLTGLADHRRLGAIPALLHPNPQRVLAVGLGAGITLRGVAAVPEVKQIDCIELSPAVIEAAKYFSTENGRISDNPKIHFIASDARSVISTSDALYDLLILDIFHPMSSGSSTIFSREYYQLCQKRLSRGGMVCQWLPVHQLSLDEIRTIIATFKSVFPHTSLWYGMIGDSTAAVGCIGSDAPLSIDVEAMKMRMQTPSLLDELTEVALGSPQLLLSNFILTGDDLTRFIDDAPIDTDNHPIIEFTAPKLSVQSSRQGMLNLIEFEKRMTEIPPPIKSTDSDFPALYAKSLAGKRAVLRGLSSKLAGNPDQQLRAYRDALLADPDNADLNAMIRVLER